LVECRSCDTSIQALSRRAGAVYGTLYQHRDLNIIEEHSGNEARQSRPTARITGMAGRSKAPFFVLILASLWSLNKFALRYLTNDAGVLGIYWSRRQWLHVHIAGAILPLLLGPVLMWFGLQRTRKVSHHLSLAAYIIGVGISATAGLYLAFHTDFGFAVGFGFASMAFAWLIATLVAAVAILRDMKEQYLEWVIRSYVLTFAFVIFRIVSEVFNVWGRGTIVEQMSAACWVSWSVPLILTEVGLQARKIFGPSKNPSRITADEIAQVLQEI